ncbi:DNA polymerase alpha subunit B [[Candida] railenensis]|uniref:DNA polymerase alpha subunit B n=1 Tax=[Candida] railenensis TaxID=45579 RepID=A0A9P0W0B0_9ASCO|nr:DNA polymerase alpha subunit B [[Candida] railenensis]
MSIKQLVSLFGPQVAKDDALIDKLKSIQEIFSIDEEDLHLHWETYNVTKAKEDLDLTVENLERLQEYIQTQIATRAPSSGLNNVNQPESTTGSGGLKRKPIMRQPMVSSSPSQSHQNGGAQHNVPSTPSLKRKKVDETPYKTPRTKFDSSPVAGEYATANNTFQSPTPSSVTVKDEVKSNTVLESLNPAIEESLGYIQLEEDASTAIKPFSLSANFDPAKYKFRTMAMKLLESADVLDDQIDSVSQLIQEKNKSVELGNPCLSTQFSIHCCGRVVPDSPIYDSNHILNATALFLETSRFGGIGQRVPLDLSNIDAYSLFPGQIVCLKGTNPTGRSFIVEEIVDIPELGAAVSSKQELNSYLELTEPSKGLKVMYVAGPFSNSHKLDYKKFDKLVDRINTEVKPHVVVLFGPFVDITNDSVSRGDIEQPDQGASRSLDEVFKRIFVPIVKKINSRISVILIPSLKDVCIKHCSFPQDSFNRKQFGLPKNVKVFPNPSSFSINELTMGVSNLDIFKDLRDVYKGARAGENSSISSNRFERISSHILEQRRYYPVVPGSIKKKFNKDKELDTLSNGFMSEELAETEIGGSSLEMPYLGLTELGDSLPDVLVVPSELKYFAKVVKGVVVVNPGYFIRPNSNPDKEDGSYVILNVKPPNVDEEENNVTKVPPTEGVSGDLYFHNACERTRVDILKS